MLRAGDETDSYPNQSQSVAVHYDAYLPDGKMWDSSRKRNRPLRFRLGVGQVIPGLDEGVAQLSRGARARISIPPELAYGARGFPGLVPPNTVITYDLVGLAPFSRSSLPPTPLHACMELGRLPVTAHLSIVVAPVGSRPQELLEIV